MGSVLTCHDGCMIHRWPCSPHESVGIAMVSLGDVPFLHLQRCEYCGALWAIGDRSAHRMSVDKAREIFDVEIPVLAWVEQAEPSQVTAVHAQLNGGALFQMLLTTEGAPRSVRERGAILPRGGTVAGEMVPLTATEAVTLATSTWGESAGAVLNLALETGIDPTLFRVLDLIQGFPVEDWEAGWQPRAARYADILGVAGLSQAERIRAAVEAAIREGVVSASDLRAAGLID
jgi:hypothetical protein